MRTHNSDIVRYLLFRLRGEASKDSSAYQGLFLGLKRELQTSFDIDLRPSSKSSWLRVKDDLDEEDFLLLLRALAELDSPNLTRLDLSHNRMGERSATALAESIRQVYLPALTHLDLSHNRIGEQSVIALAEVLETGYLAGLTWLDLSESFYRSTSNGEKGSYAIARALMSGYLSGLHHLGLPPCHLDSVVNSFWEGRIRNLSYLHLSGCSAHSSRDRLTSIGELFQIVKNMPLEHIHLRRCGLTWDVMEEFTRALVTPGNGHRYLQHLDLSENNLGVRGVVSLGKIMKEGNLANLHHLSLGLCGIEEISQVRALEDGIRFGKSELTHLDLSSNKLGFYGTCALVNVIEEGRLSTLQHLNLSHCNMQIVARLDTLRPGKPLRTRSYLDVDERDVLDFIEVIKKGHLSRLKFLDMSFNKLSTAGCIALSRVIQRGSLPDLHQLHLCGCGIKDNGVMGMVEAMGAGQLAKLQYLDLGFNKFDDPGIEAVARALKKGLVPKLRFLNLYLLRLHNVPLSKRRVASTYESLYAAAGIESNRSLARDIDMLVRISFFWAQKKREHRLAKREAIMDQLADSVVDAFTQNSKLVTTVVGFGKYDSLLQQCRNSNLQFGLHSRKCEEETCLTSRTLALAIVILSLGFYLYMV